MNIIDIDSGGTKTDFVLDIAHNGKCEYYIVTSQFSQFSVNGALFSRNKRFNKQIA